MPKATLEFDLNDLDDRAAHRHAIHGLDWALCCQAMAEKLRAYLKYGHEFETVEDALE